MNAIIYYDVDETLFTHDPEHAPAVLVLDQNGNHVERLDGHSFPSHIRRPGHEYDFSEYRSAERFSQSVLPVINLICRAKQDHDLGYKVELLTARGDMDNKQIVIDTFAKYGIYIDDTKDPNYIHLHRAGNHGHDSPGKNKYIHITNAIKKHGYDHIRMYDDNYKMCEVMQRISKENSIKTIFHHILVPHHEGKFETYTFYNGELIENDRESDAWNVQNTQ